MPSWCIWSKDDLSDLEYIVSYIFNKINYIQYNSTLGKYVGYTALGIKNADRWNNDPAHMQAQKAAVETFCKNNVGNYYSAILSKTGENKNFLFCNSSCFFPILYFCDRFTFYFTWV